MKVNAKITGIACLLAGALGTFGQTVGLGLNFASTDPDAATSSLLPEEVAGVIPQANWNNFTGATGTGVGSLVYDNAGTAAASTATATWTSPNTWRSGANNAFPAGPDRKLLSGYLDTSNTATTGVNVTVNNIDPVFTSGGYDVYVYFVSDSAANRGGAYTLNDGVTNVVKYGSTLAAPAAFVEDPGTDQNLSLDGNYLRFRQLTGTSFTLRTDTTLTTPNGTRAPINAIQIVPSPLFGPTVTRQPVGMQLYAGRTARFSAAVDGYPAVTTVRWQKDGADLTDGGRISGATTTTLTITDAQPADVGDYTLVVTSPRGTVTSDAAALAIVTPENSPYITALLNAGPLANWRLNEPEATTSVFDAVGGFTGQYVDTAIHGASVPGPQLPGFIVNDGGATPPNSAMQLSGPGAPGYALVPTPTINTNTATFIAWINPSAAQPSYTGIFNSRTGTLAGLNYTTDNQLGYTWNNNNAATWGFNSGLRPVDNDWSMVVLVINTNRATIYLANGGTISAAINPITHNVEAWGNQARIGDDTPGGAGRTFDGEIDEVAMFNRALSFDEVAAIYAAATGAAQNPAPVFGQQPLSATRFVSSSVQFRTSVTSVGNVTYQWKKGAANVTDDARISGATTDTLTIRDLTAADAADYTLVATNPNGSTTSAIATLTILPSPNAYVTEVLADRPLSYWRFNESGDPSAGTLIASDYVGGRDGTYGVASLIVAGPRPDQSFGAFEPDNNALRPSLNLANSWVTAPPLGIATNQMTFLAWINPTTRVNNSGIIFARAGQPATGLGLAGTGNLGYSWLDQAATYNFASGLTPALNQWSLVAVAVEPTRAVLYLINADGVRSATNTVAHNVRTFSDNFRIGGDPNNNNRTFDGAIDEAAIFDRALTHDELNRLFQRALGSVPPTIAASPAATERFTGDTVTLTVSAVGTAPLTYRWEKFVGDTFVPVVNGGNISGADTGTLTITNATATDAGQYRAIASNSLGSATSEVGTVTLLPAPAVPGTGTFGAAALAQEPIAYWRLNETGDPSSGTLLAFDHSSNRLHGVYGIASQNGFHQIAGPRPPDFTVFEDTNTALATFTDGDQSWATMPPLGVTTDTMTIVAWIKPTTLVANGGIAFWRAGQPATGLGLGGAGNLGYHWLDTAGSYNWNSGLTPPLDVWSMVAIVIEPTAATAYLLNQTSTQSAVNPITHAARTFSDQLRIGNDPNNVNRTFNGAIDEVAIFNEALTAGQIQDLFAGRIIPDETGSLAISQSNGQITISWQGSGTLQSTTALNGAATQWTNETTTGNTFTTAATGQMKFYRLAN